MALRLACNLAVKIRVFYKTGLPGSAHRATPVFRSLTSPLCRSTNERFRSSWHGRPSARIPYPRRPAPCNTFPLVPSPSTVFGETPTPSRASVVLKRHIFRPHSLPLLTSFHRLRSYTKAGVTSPRGSRYARHTIHGDLPCFFTGCITRFFTSSTDPASVTCLLIGSLTRPPCSPPRSTARCTHVRHPLSAPISPSANRVSGRYPAASTEPKIDRSGKDYRPCAMWP